MGPVRSGTSGSGRLDGRRPARVEAAVVPPMVGVASRTWRALRRKLEHAHERRRMRRIARWPGELTAFVGGARTVLFVCHGNLIRSPFGAGLLRLRLAEPSGIAVLSGGLWAATGHPADATAMKCAERFGVDLKGHRTRPLERGDVEAADILFVMEIRHLLELRRRFPEAYRRTYLLGCLTPSGPLEVSDPASGSLAGFEACYHQIEDGVNRIVAILASAPARLACGSGT